jgi:hypothetical protein
LVMTAVPGAPGLRRLLSSSSPSRGSSSRGTAALWAALAVVSVGLRLMGTYGSGHGSFGAQYAENHRCIISTAPPRFQIVVPLESSGILTHFVRQIPCRPATLDSIDGLNCGQIGAVSSEICGFPLATFPSCRLRDLPDNERTSAGDAAALGCGSDARRHFAAGLHLPGGQSFAQKQSPAHAAGLFICFLRRNDALLHRGNLAELALEGLIGLAGKVGVEFTELGRLRHKALIGALGIVALNLDRFFE